jgi:hypothetical protein
MYCDVAKKAVVFYAMQGYICLHRYNLMTMNNMRREINVSTKQ